MLWQQHVLSSVSCPPLPSSGQASVLCHLRTSRTLHASHALSKVLDKLRPTYSTQAILRLILTPQINKRGAKTRAFEQFLSAAPANHCIAVLKHISLHIRLFLEPRNPQHSSSQDSSTRRGEEILPYMLVTPHLDI